MIEPARPWACLFVGILISAGCARATTPVLTERVRIQNEDHNAHSDLGARQHTALDEDDGNIDLSKAPQPVPAGRQGRWLLFSNHNHSTYWDGKKPLTVMQQEAYLQGLDAFALTDHNTMRGALSPEFQAPPGHLTMVKGMEWNAFRERGEEVVGHASLLGLRGNENITTGLSLDAMLREATRRNATIVINHPFTLNNVWKQSEPDARVHGIEVWNGWWARVKPVINNDKALAWWDKSLRAGRRLTALSGTDNHGQWYDDISRNVNIVFAETRDEAGILGGIRAGRVTITKSPTSGRIYLEADANGDGQYESMMGDTVPRGANGVLNIRVHVLGGQGKKVVLYTAAGRWRIFDVTKDKQIISCAIPVRPRTDFVRAELRRFPRLNTSMTAISNPIYIR